MRIHEAFVLGVLTGAVVVWQWRRPIEDAVGEKTRELRTKAADRLQAVEATLRPA
jgi:hypothetical protein